MKFFSLYIFLCLFVGCASKTDVVDSSTLNNKVMCGYQGWFTAPGDENKFDCWMHWAIRGGELSSSNLAFDMYPDLSEFDDDELFPTKMTMNGTNAFLYSGRTYKTINRHVKWMKQYGIDGVFAQRFVTNIEGDSDYSKHIKTVGRNLLKSCEEYGRVFAFMYDISGYFNSKFRFKFMISLLW